MVGPSSTCLCLYKKRLGHTKRRDRDVHTHRGKAREGHSKKVAVCKPRREALGKSRSWRHLHLGCQASRMWEDKFLLVRPLSLRYFVIVGLVLIHISLVQSTEKSRRLPWWLTSNSCHNVESTIYSFVHYFVHLLIDSVNIYWPVLLGTWIKVDKLDKYFCFMIAKVLLGIKEPNYFSLTNEWAKNI